MTADQEEVLEASGGKRRIAGVGEGGEEKRAWSPSTSMAEKKVR